MSALTFKVGGDTSGLNKAVATGKRALRGLVGVGKRAGQALGRGAFVAAASGLAAMTASAIGLRKALDLGGSLSDVAANTGLLAGEALILQRAFEDAGVSGDKLQPTINKMQRSLVEAGEGVVTYQRAFNALGIDIEKMRSLRPEEQFDAVQKALAATEDPAERAARAMQIFGRSGAELQALFSNKGALANARVSVGDQAEILNKQADNFDRASDLLGGAGKKLTGFFVGMANFINPVLLPVLERLNTVDLAGYGRAAGRFIAVITEGFRQGALPRMLGDGLVLAGKRLINQLVKGFRGILTMLWEGVTGIPRIFVGAVKTIANPFLWKSIGRILVSSARLAAFAFTDLLPDRLFKVGERNVLKELIDGEQNIIRQNLKLASMAAEPFKDAAGQTGGEMAKAFLDEWRGSDLIDTSAETRRLRETMQRLRDTVDRNTEETNKEAERPELPFSTVQAREEIRSRRPIVSSLARVGGAILGTPRDRTMDRERNDLLRRIERNTRGNQVATFA